MFCDLFFIIHSENSLMHGAMMEKLSKSQCPRKKMCQIWFQQVKNNTELEWVLLLFLFFGANNFKYMYAKSER